MRALAALLPWLLLPGCGDPADERAWFRDVTQASGVTSIHQFGTSRSYWIPEITGSGVALFDADGDEDLDIFFVQGADLRNPGAPASRDQLWINRGDGTFTDGTEAAGIDERLFGMGVTVGDVDGDGDVDLFVTNVGQNVLWVNDGEGRFHDGTEAAGLRDDVWSTSAAFLDHDGDGDLDLFVCNYMAWTPEAELECVLPSGVRDYCAPGNYEIPAPDTLWENLGNGRFRDASESSGIGALAGTALGVAWADLTDDGLPDVYVANDGMQNHLWVNQGGGRFEESSLVYACGFSGEGKTEAGMGVVLADLDEDHGLDLLVTHVHNETNTFYRKHGRWFRDDTGSTGMVSASLGSTGFGLGAEDFDQDGLLDLYVANGRVANFSPRADDGAPYAEPDQVFRGLGGGRFEEVTRPVHGEPLTVARGAAFGDLDGDGDIDVVVSENGGPLRVLENVVSGSGRWVTLDLRLASGAPALGARLEAEVGGRATTRLAQAAASFASANDPRIHLGLGEVEALEGARLHWPNGAIEELPTLAAGSVHRLVQGEPR